MPTVSQQSPSACVMRTFLDDRPPNVFSDFTGEKKLAMLESAMKGSAWKLQLPDPTRLRHQWMRLTSHQEGEHTYVGICFIPESQKELWKDFNGKSDITAMPEVVVHSPSHSLESVIGGLIVIDNFPAKQLVDYMIIIEEGDQKKLVYRGKEIDPALADKIYLP